MTTESDWIDEIEAPEGSITLCLKGKLVAEHERLSAQLAEMPTAATSLAGDGPGADIADRLVQLREEMLAHNKVFTFRAVTPRVDWRLLRGKQPVRTEGGDEAAYGEEYHAWMCGMVAASALDPVMTVEQVGRLADRLSNAQWTKLANKAWSVNEEDEGIPFSAAASALSRSSGEKSKQPEPSTSPARGSLAGSPSSDTTTTTVDG